MADPYQPVYLDTAQRASSFLDSIAEVRELAIDTEGASFHRYVDRIYLLQLSTQHHSAIVDPLHAGKLPELGALVENRGVELIFHDADYDLRLLRQDYGWHATHLFDTRIAAQLLGIPAFGLAALLEKFFSVRLDKQHQRADWSMRPLTPGMLDYAGQDTRYLLELRDELRTRLEAAGRMSWAQEEFERLESVHFTPDDPDTAFMRTKGARDLKRRELALLKELVAWRDQRASALDRATFRVMGNEAMFEIIRVKPASRDELAAIKGVPRGVVDRHSAELLDAVQRGLAVPEADLPRFPRAARWDRDPDFDSNVSKLKAARDAAAIRLKLDPGVLCARERLEAVARRKPRSIEELREIPELRRWQAEVLGPDFVAALKG
jgi:ribonuclease D